MPTVTANGMRIEYDTFGDPTANPFLLVMGLGAQMIAWEEEFCTQLADAGHYVIRFDNRDVGLSEHFDSAGVPNVEKLIRRSLTGEQVESPYTLDDMADDAWGLLEALGIASSHICGASMGGMIVQTMAIRQPQRVRSLTSIMSTTGNPDLPPPKPEALAALTGPAPATREEAIDEAVRTKRITSGNRFPFDEDQVRRLAAISFDRSFYPEGTARQMAAIVAHGSRVQGLRNVRIPSLVIHGTADPLVPVEGGIDTAKTITGAEMVLIEGMGHELPRETWPEVIDSICRLTLGTTTSA